VFLRIQSALRATLQDKEQGPSTLPEPDGAIASPQQIPGSSPEVFDPHNMMGAALMAQGKLDAAVYCWQQGLRLNPYSADAHNNLGVALYRLGRPQEALACFEHALRLRTHFPEALNNKGNALGAMRRLEDALACYQQALGLKPDFAEAHLGSAHALLLTGDFAQGWPENEWRRRCPGFAAAPLYPPLPEWDGTPLKGRTLLLRAEQGLGDTVQFIRYASLVQQQRGPGRIVVEAQPQLLSLLRSCPGVDQVIAQGEMPPSCDVYAFLMSLPWLMETNLSTVPADVPYLGTHPGLTTYWHKELSAIRGFKVGIVWQGRAAYSLDHYRSVPLAEFAPLANVKGVHLFSLQVEAGNEQLAALGGLFDVTDLGSRFDPASFADAAAVMKNLDLVVTVDTALAHLAGALDVPVWVALSFTADWRWLLEREDNPWYPTMRLFRQPQSGQWPAVFEGIAGEVRNRVVEERL
jgi:hypothetical protein